MSTRKKVLLSTILLVLFSGALQAESLPANWRQSLVSIEAISPKGGNVYQEIGTGFWLTTDTAAPFRVILFTANHVLQDACDLGILEVQLRPDAPPETPDSAVRRFPLKICERQIAVDKASGIIAINVVPLWTKHPTADLAAIIPVVDKTSPHMDVVPFFADLLPTEADLKKWNVSEGDDVLGIVYSPNISNQRPSEALVRQGIISEFRERKDTFLVSLLAFPGNSGAPIFLKQTGLHLGFNTGIQFGSVNPLYLLGVITAYIPYREVAISSQTKQPRVMFEENPGIASVVSSGRIRELLDVISKKFQQSVVPGTAHQ
jgi:hypothetical protein